jgi:hypothetical protein
MKIVEYGVIKADSLQELVNKVTLSIAQGFQPLGSMTFVPTFSDNSGKQFVQVIVKYE